MGLPEPPPIVVIALRETLFPAESLRAVDLGSSFFNRRINTGPTAGKHAHMIPIAGSTTVQVQSGPIETTHRGQLFYLLVVPPFPIRFSLILTVEVCIWVAE
jgi:hypothetical protein